MTCYLVYCFFILKSSPICLIIKTYKNTFRRELIFNIFRRNDNPMPNDTRIHKTNLYLFLLVKINCEKLVVFHLLITRRFYYFFYSSFTHYMEKLQRGLRGSLEGVPRGFRGINLSEPLRNPLGSLSKSSL